MPTKKVKKEKKDEYTPKEKEIVLTFNFGEDEEEGAHEGKEEGEI